MKYHITIQQTGEEKHLKGSKSPSYTDMYEESGIGSTGAIITDMLFTHTPMVSKTVYILYSPDCADDDDEDANSRCNAQICLPLMHSMGLLPKQ